MVFVCTCSNSLFGLMFVRSLYRPLSFYAQFRSRLGALKVSPSMCLIGFHSGLLCKGPDKRADGNRDHHLRARDRGEPTPGTTGDGGRGMPWGGEGRGAWQHRTPKPRNPKTPQPSTLYNIEAYIATNISSFGFLSTVVYDDRWPPKPSSKSKGVKTPTP